MVGCSVDTVEESDANILEPSAAPRTQNLPVLDNGSLIPTEEVPVITIEKAREDADFLLLATQRNSCSNARRFSCGSFRRSRIA